MGDCEGRVTGEFVRIGGGVALGDERVGAVAGGGAGVGAGVGRGAGRGAGVEPSSEKPLSESGPIPPL